MQQSFILTLLVPADLLSSSSWIVFILSTVEHAWWEHQLHDLLFSACECMYRTYTYYPDTYIIYKHTALSFTFSVSAGSPADNYRYLSRTRNAAVVHTVYDTVVLGQGILKLFILKGENYIHSKGFTESF